MEIFFYKESGIVRILVYFYAFPSIKAATFLMQNLILAIFTLFFANNWLHKLSSKRGLRICAAQNKFTPSCKIDLAGPFMT